MHIHIQKAAWKGSLPPFLKAVNLNAHCVFGKATAAEADDRK